MDRNEIYVDPAIMEAMNASPTPTPEEVCIMFEEFRQYFDEDDAWESVSGIVIR